MQVEKIEPFNLILLELNHYMLFNIVWNKQFSSYSNIEKEIQ